MTASIDINGIPSLSGKIFEPRVGTWWGEAEFSAEQVPSGAAILTIYGELEFHGTVTPSRTATDAGRVTVRFDAGSGLLDERVPAKSFKGTTARAVVDDLVRETGDVVDETSTVLSKQIAFWTNPETLGEAVAYSVAQECACAWRFQRVGQLWFGVETWPALDLDYTQGPIGPGQTVIQPDNLPLVRPGVTFQGRKVAEVVTSWGEGALQQQVVFEDTDTPGPFTRSIQTEIVDWFKRTFGTQLDLSSLYPCRVMGQSADYLTVDLLPDDARVRGQGLQGVPLRYGSPGMRHRLKTGARCKLGWDAADPKRPFACLFERDGVAELFYQPDDGSPLTINVVGAPVNIISDTTVQITGGAVLVNEGGQEVACKGDLVAIASPTAVAPGSPCAPALPGAPALMGVIVSGRARFKAS